MRTPLAPHLHRLFRPPVSGQAPTTELCERHVDWLRTGHDLRAEGHRDRAPLCLAMFDQHGLVIHGEQTPSRASHRRLRRAGAHGPAPLWGQRECDHLPAAGGSLVATADGTRRKAGCRGSGAAQWETALRSLPRHSQDQQNWQDNRGRGEDLDSPGPGAKTGAGGKSKHACAHTFSLEEATASKHLVPQAGLSRAQIGHPTIPS